MLLTRGLHRPDSMTTVARDSFVDPEEASEASSTPDGKHESASALPDLATAFLNQYLAGHDGKDIPRNHDGSPDMQRIMQLVLGAMTAGKSSAAEPHPTSLPTIAEASFLSG